LRRGKQVIRYGFIGNTARYAPHKFFISPVRLLNGTATIVIIRYGLALTTQNFSSFTLM
jgi:hypothetical protein